MLSRGHFSLSPALPLLDTKSLSFRFFLAFSNGNDFVQNYRAWLNVLGFENCCTWYLVKDQCSVAATGEGALEWESGGLGSCLALLGGLSGLQTLNE